MTDVNLLEELQEFQDRTDDIFVQKESQQHARAYLLWLLRRHTESRQAKLANLGHIVSRGSWDVDRLWEELNRYVVNKLGNVNACLVPIKTGFAKPDIYSAGAVKQVNPDNYREVCCQVGMFLAYATPDATVFVDSRLYVPPEWINAVVSSGKTPNLDGVPFASIQGLEQMMLEQANAENLPFRWAASDEFGFDDRVRTWLESIPVNYVIRNSTVQPWPLVRAFTAAERSVDLPQHALHEETPSGSFLWRLFRVGPSQSEGWQRSLLVRRQRTPNRDSAFAPFDAFDCFAPVGTPIDELVGVVHRCWDAKHSLEDAKTSAGLANYRFRKATSWRLHMMLALWAHAISTVAALRSPGRRNRNRVLGT